MSILPLACSLTLMLTAAEPSPALVVKAFPNGYRDADVAYLYNDRLSTVSFYLFAADQPVTMEDVVLELGLPEGLDVRSYAFFNSNRKSYDAQREERDSATVWRLRCEDRVVPKKFAATRWTVYSFYHVYVYLEPTAALDREQFALEWRFCGGTIEPANGVIQVRLLPGPTGRKNPRRFVAWTGDGYHSEMLDEVEYDSFLALARECGITGIVQAGLPNKRERWLKWPDRVRERGFALVDRTIIPKYVRASFPKSEQDRVPADEEYRMLLANGRRSRSPCPTMLATKGTPLFEMLMGDLAKAYAQGFRHFFVDYEMPIYTGCYCEHCRRSFAECLSAQPEAVAAQAPLDLIHRHPLDWYKFRSWQTGKLFQCWKQVARTTCPDIQLGLNGTFSFPAVHTKGLGYGTSFLFCEDPRFTDFGVDFHNTDQIKGGLEDITRMKLWFSPADSYGVKITKPVIGRAGAFCDINWHYFCVVGRRAYVRSRNRLMGTDRRGELLKLQIANMAALGVRGVEIQFGADITDALITNEADKAMEFVAEFEDFLLDGRRMDSKRVQVYDLTEGTSPYHEIGPKGYFDKIYFYGPGQRYGFVQYQGIDRGPDQLVTLFNWDLHQPKRLHVRVPGREARPSFVHALVDGERALLVPSKSLTAWDAEALGQGVTLEVPAGGIAGLWLSTRRQEGYAEMLLSAPCSVEGKSPIDLMAWRAPTPAEPTTVGFEEHIYNRCLRGMKKRLLPDLPERYLK